MIAHLLGGQDRSQCGALRLERRSGDLCALLVVCCCPVRCCDGFVRAVRVYDLVPEETMIGPFPPQFYIISRIVYISSAFLHFFSKIL